MATAAKSAAIAELTEHFRRSGAAVLTEYRGLTVKQLTQLRTQMRDHATYAVVKNTLTELAAKEAGVTAFDGQLAGPSAIAFITGDPVEAAKTLRDFAKAVYLFAAPLSKAARTVDALRAKVESEGGSAAADPQDSIPQDSVPQDAPVEASADATPQDSSTDDA